MQTLVISMVANCITCSKGCHFGKYRTVRQGSPAPGVPVFTVAGTAEANDLIAAREGRHATRVIYKAAD